MISSSAGNAEPSVGVAELQGLGCLPQENRMGGGGCEPNFALAGDWGFGGRSGVWSHISSWRLFHRYRAIGRKDSG